MPETLLSHRAYDFLVYLILRLSMKGCPSFFSDGTEFPYDELIEFALSLDNASPEDQDFVRQSIRSELEQGSYLERYHHNFSSFSEAVGYFLSEDGAISMNDCFFGRVVLEECERILNN